MRRRRFHLAVLAVAALVPLRFKAQQVSMPNRSDSVKFAAIQDRSFMLNEIAGDDLFFHLISRTVETVDQGVIHREGKS